MAHTQSVRALSPGDLGIGQLFERVRDAVVVANAADGRVVLWNPGAEKMFGYSAADAAGLLVEDLVPAHLKPRHRAGLAHYFATGHGAIVDAGAVVEVPALRKAGDQITIELSLSPINQPALAGRFVLAIIRDVSERAALRAEAARRLRELETLYEADETLHRSLELKDVLQALVDLATDILAADKTAVVVWDARHQRLVVGATRGFNAESVARMSISPDEGITGRVVSTGEAIVVEDANLDTRVLHAITDPEGIRSLIHVPIQVDGEILGVFSVNYCHDHTFTGDERRMLSALAERAALAIANAHQYQRAQDTATLDERRRLAQELHDAVTQTLFAAGLNAQALPSLWAADPDGARRCVEDIQRLIWGALAEMRSVLVELRPASLIEMDLADLVRQLAQAATGRAPGLSVELIAEGQRGLPAEAQVVFYRVAQEALSNVVKHAGARHVEVRLIRQPGNVLLAVKDDGRGFDPLMISPEHLGLGIMQERVDSIDGVLSIESGPDQGTHIRLTWSDAQDAGRLD